MNLRPGEDRISRLQTKTTTSASVRPANSDAASLLYTDGFGRLLSALREAVVVSGDQLRVENSNRVINREVRQYLRDAICDVANGSSTLESAFFELSSYYEGSQKNFSNHLKSEYEERYGRYRRIDVSRRYVLEPELLVLVKLSILQRSDYLGIKFVAALTDNDKESARYQLASSVIKKLDDTLLLKLIGNLPYSVIKGSAPDRLARELYAVIGGDKLTPWMNDIYSMAVEESRQAEEDEDATKIEILNSRLNGLQAFILEVIDEAEKKGERVKHQYELLKDIYCNASNESNKERAKNLIIDYLYPEASQTFYSIASDQLANYEVRIRALHDFIDVSGNREQEKLFDLVISSDSLFVQYACERLASSRYGEKGKEIIANAAIAQIKERETPVILTTLFWCGARGFSCHHVLKYTLGQLSNDDLSQALFALEFSSGNRFYDPSVEGRFDNFYSSISIRERSFNKIMLQLSPITLLSFHEEGGLLSQNATLVLQRAICREDSADVRKSLVESLVANPLSLEYLRGLVGMQGFKPSVDFK